MPYGNGRWIDENNRSHNWSGEVASTDRNQIESQIRAQTGAKNVIIGNIYAENPANYKNKRSENLAKERERFAEQERNLRSGGNSSQYDDNDDDDVSYSNSGSSLNFSGGSGGTWLVGLLGGAALLLYFTPWVLMTAYGAGATWLTQKIVGISISDFADKDDDITEDEFKKGISILIAAIVFGGFGFIHGTVWNKDLNKEYNLDGNQTKVEQVRQK